MLNFTPKTEKEITEEGLLPRGFYDFEVVGAESGVSKKGNPFIKVKLKVFGKDKEVFIFDYLMEAMMHKLLHFCESTGLKQKYDEGCITPEDCAGRSGRLLLEIDAKDPAFAPKNVVKDYEVPKSALPSNMPKEDKDEEDDIPF